MGFTALHLFCGLGGGALGFKRAGFQSAGAVDFDASACQDFGSLVGEEATLADLSTMTVEELRAICPTSPDVVFASPPCKGFSGCLPQAVSDTAKYQAMNSLVERTIFLVLSAWERPPRLILLENVPRIQSRGKAWLERVDQMLSAHGYATHRSTHDCGELGGLAQRRRRYLVVARHIKQVPEFLYEPPQQRVRGIGEVLGQLPVPRPGSSEGGPLHELDRLSALNWLRLACVPAGKDWKSLPSEVALSERPSRHNGGFGVVDWGEPCLLYTSPSPRDRTRSRMPSSA